MGFSFSFILGICVLLVWNATIFGASLEPSKPSNSSLKFEQILNETKLHYNETNTTEKQHVTSNHTSILSTNSFQNKSENIIKTINEDILFNNTFENEKNNLSTTTASNFYVPPPIFLNSTSHTNLTNPKTDISKNETYILQKVEGSLPYPILKKLTDSLPSKEFFAKYESNFTNDENLVDITTTQKPEIKKDLTERTNSSRSIDVRNYTPSEFVDDPNKYKNKQLDFDTDQSNYFDSQENTDTTISTTTIDDKHIADSVTSHLKPNSGVKSKNFTKTEYERTKVQNLNTNTIKNDNDLHSSQVFVENTNRNYEISFNETEISEDTSNEKDFPNIDNSNSIKSKESYEKDDNFSENGNSKELKSTTNNDNVTKIESYDLLPKPPVLDKNESRPFILTNSIIENKSKGVKKDPYYNTYSPKSDSDITKEHVDPHLVDGSSKPIVITKRGKGAVSSNETANFTKDSLSSGSNDLELVTRLPTATTPTDNKSRLDFGKATNEETVANNFINSSDISSKKAEGEILNSVESDDKSKMDIDEKFKTTTPVTSTLNHNGFNFTTVESLSNYSILIPTTEQINRETVATSTVTEVLPNISTTEITSTADMLTTIIYSTETTPTALTSTTTDILTSTLNEINSTITTEVTLSTTDGDLTDATSPEIDITTVSLPDKSANTSLSKETFEDGDVVNRNDGESKETVNEDDDDDIDESSTTMSSDILGDNTENSTDDREKVESTKTVANTTSSSVEILHVASIGPHQTTLIPETFQPDQSYLMPNVSGNIGRGIVPEVDETIEATTLSESHDIVTDNDGNGTTIAAIVISCIGAVCLFLLVGLLVIIKRRQKTVNYGQRCTPVSLDAYSVDNVSVYNSVRRKAAIRASKRSYGNPAFDDSCSISNPLNFNSLTKFAINREAINAEFDEVPQVFAQMNELPEGCDIKNRYANVIPLPETRVFLTFIDGYPNSDYINANYVTGPNGTKNYYIACQAPLQTTVDDFWRMVWEQNSRLILMLTNFYENHVEKCADYLPPSEVLDCHRLFGDFEVTLKKREVKEKYVISILQLKNMVSNSWREVTHMWYIGWPEKGVPMEYNSMIAFLIEARSYLKIPSSSDSYKVNEKEVNPVVVHCSPGTGRTGTVIACDMAIREFEISRKVDIPKLVYRIRRDRAGAVQTKDQYAFIYKVVNTYAVKLTGGVALENI